MPNPRKPEALKRLEGTFRKDRAADDRLEVDPCRIPVAPKHLNDTERQIWTRLRKVLQPLGVIAETDLDAFAAMIRAVAWFQSLLAIPDADPKQVIAASKEARSWLREFGLTPASRSTVRMTGGEEAEKTLDDFMN